MICPESGWAVQSHPTSKFLLMHIPREEGRHLRLSSLEPPRVTQEHLIPLASRAGGSASSSPVVPHVSMSHVPSSVVRIKRWEKVGPDLHRRGTTLKSDHRRSQWPKNGTTGERDPKPTWSWSPVLGHAGGTRGTRGRSCETPQLQVFGEPLRDDLRGKQGGEGADKLIRGTAPWCDVSSRNSA